MTYVHPAWIAHQRQRWLRPDWQRFVKPEPILRKSYAQRLVEQQQAEEQQVAEDEHDGLNEDLRGLRLLVKGLKLDLAIRRLRNKAGFNPDQPRDEHGRWSDGGGDQAINDGRVLSDATPDEVTAGARYAQVRRGTVTVRIGNRAFQLEAGQAARLEEAQARADGAISRVREIDPNWRPTPSLKETAEGSIRAYEAEAREAQAKANELAGKGLFPGPFASGSIPARGPDRIFNAQERDEINRLFDEGGCHTCGTRNPGTPSGNAVADHQPPSALAPAGTPQRLFPQCLSCSLMQGGHARALKRGR